MDLTIVKDGPVDEVGVRTSGGCWNQASWNFRSKHIFLDWLEPGNHWLIISFQSGTFSKHKTCQKNHDNNITMCDTTAEIVLLLLFLCVFWDWWSLFDSWLKLTPINLLLFLLVGARYSFCHYNREIYNSNQIGICLACLDTPCFLPHFSVHFPPCFIDSGLQISCYTIFITYIMLNNILFN